MNLKLIPMSESVIQVQIEGVDYSISDIVHKELLSVKHVKFAGIAPPHPLLKILTIQVHTEGISPRTAVSEAAKTSTDKVEELLKVVRQTFPNIAALIPLSGQIIREEDQP